jgi:segregation and condensation protein B
VTSDDAAARSLAEQAATWVPPWARKPAEPQPAAEPDLESEQVSDPEPVTEAEATPEPGASAILEDLTSNSMSNLPRSESDGTETGETGELAPTGEAEPAGTDGHTEILENSAPNLVPNSPRSEGDEGEPGAELEAEPVDPAEPVADPVGPAEPAEPEPVIEPEDLQGALEAIMLVVDEPISEIMLAQVLDVPVERINAALRALASEYTDQRRGFDLRQAAGGWRLYTRGDFAAYVEKFVLDGQQVRLTQAALETLAVIAYKQPVTRSRISAIRGVNCDGVVRTLMSRGLIEECGSEPDSGAFLYRTTTLFLEKLGLNSVDELPPLAPFLPDDVDEIANAQG